MKITLEFTNIENFFSELPRFAALMNFSGQFASFDHVKKSELVSSLEEPVLPEAFRGETGGTRVAGTPEQLQKTEAPDKVAKETTDMLEQRKAAETVESAPVTTAEAAPKEKPSKSPAKEKKAEKEPDSSPEEHVYTKVEATHVLGYLIQNDHRDDVKKILNDAGAENLRTMDPSHYGEAIKAARAFIPDDVFEKLLDPKKYKEVLKTK